MYHSLAKYRLVYSYLMAVMAIACAGRHPIYWGLILCVAGMAVRFWAAGNIRKNDEVSKSGPYAFTRNPLYLGSFLGALGAFVLGRELVPTIIFVVTFAIFYGSTIRSEEDWLSGHYKEDYAEYKRNVPVFLPRLTPYKSGSASSFSWAQALSNKEHKYSSTTVLVPILVLIVGYLKH
jgi:protein-S-isoprenylcysteine O-methyltransferase Ste14